MNRTRSTQSIDRIIAWSIDNPLPPVGRYLAATMLILLIALVRATLVTALLPWLLFIPAILVIALALGEGPGLYASLLAAVAAGLSIGSPAEPLFLTPPQWSGSALFLLVAFAIARTGGELRAAFRRARALNAELLDRKNFLSGVLESSTDCIKVLDLDGRICFMSEGGLKVMEVGDFNQIEGCPWPDFWSDAGNDDARRALARAQAGQATHFVGKADTFLGTPKWWNVSVSPILGADGKPDRILSVSRDTTDLVAAQEQQRLLNGELGHRLKNVLSLVQSIANQTFRQAESLETANRSLAARLVALGKATSVLTNTAWQSATLTDVIEAGLVSIDGLRDRVRLHGPEVRLDAQVAMALTLALHELTTNACKYGSLSNDAGCVTIGWDVTPAADGGDERFRFTWREAGGPTVSAPTRSGFGSKMIERSLAAYFRGETKLDYRAEGVVFCIDAPLPAAMTGLPGTGAP